MPRPGWVRPVHLLDGNDNTVENHGTLAVSDPTQYAVRATAGNDAITNFGTHQWLDRPGCRHERFRQQNRFHLQCRNDREPGRRQCAEQCRPCSPRAARVCR